MNRISIGQQQKKETMTKSSIFILILLLSSSQCFGDYTLQFDWSTTSSNQEEDVGYVTWNQETLLTLTNDNKKKETRKQFVSLSFNEGSNQLGVYFVGMSGTMAIDNVQITKDSKPINYVLNGDFELANLGNSKFQMYSNRIPGWHAPSITIQRSKGGSIQLILTTQARSVTQSISFGSIRKYEFVNSINSAIQNQAKEIFNSNLLSVNINLNPKNIWNSPVPISNRTSTSPSSTPTPSPTSSTTSSSITLPTLNIPLAPLFKLF